MKSNKLLFAALLVTALPASAAVISPVNLNGNSYADYSAQGLLALDINASNLGPLLFNVSFNAGEIAAGSVAFNAIFNNLSGSGFRNLLLDFGNLSVNAGTVQSDWNDTPAGSWNVSQNGGRFLASSGNGASEFFGLLIGDPLLTGAPLNDWRINTSGLSTTGSYALRVQTVPEPGQLALMGVGLVMLSALRRRRKI